MTDDTIRIHFGPHGGDKARRVVRDLLARWGIRPRPGRDEGGRYFDFTLPRHWPASKRRRFLDILGDHPCAWCGTATASALCDCACGCRVPACTDCLAAGRGGGCKGCGLPYTPVAWPGPPAGEPPARLAATFAALLGRCLAALVRVARWCELECRKGPDSGHEAIILYAAVARRLHGLEAAWAAAGVTAEGAGVDLAPEMAALRAAALELGAALARWREIPNERGEALIDALLEASAPFMLDEGGERPEAA